MSSLFGPVADDLEALEHEFTRSFAGDDQAAAAPFAALFAAGGKRLRPALVLLSGRTAQYDLPRLRPAAMAVELLHGATLVHDDVIDRSATRRGRPTVAASAGAEAAIVIGDHYFAKAYLEASATGDPAIVAILAEAVMRICSAELGQREARHRWAPDIDAYMNRIEGKTASLLSAACRAGARLGGQDAEAQEALARFGLDLGMAFQVVDDVLDYTASPEELGKPVGQDLEEGMPTLPLMLSSAALELLRPGAAPDAATRERVLTLVREGPGPALAMERAREYAGRARARLEGFGGPASDSLLALADYVVARRL